MDGRAADSLLALAEEAVPALSGLDAEAVFADLERRDGELRAALDWFVEHGRANEALRLATALTPFLRATKRLAEAGAVLQRVLALPGGDHSRRGRAMFDAGMVAFFEGDDERATALHEQGLALGRGADDPTVVALALSGLARIALRADVERARALCREALAVTEGTSDRFGRSSALHVLGVAAQMAGDLDEARTVMRERLEVMRQLENYAGISGEAGNLSMVERQLGHLYAAESLAREALEIDFRRGDVLQLPWKLNGLAAVAVERGEHERAARLIGAADAMRDEHGAAWPPDERVHYDRTIAAATDALGAAAFERAYTAGRSLTSSEVAAYALRV